MDLNYAWYPGSAYISFLRNSKNEDIQWDSKYDSGYIPQLRTFGNSGNEDTRAPKM